MCALARLRMIGNKPYHGFGQLAVGYHKIESFRLVKNKFADKESDKNQKTILVELEDQVLFLPQYFMNAINESEIDELNSADEVHYLYYGGKRENKK